MVPIDWVMGLVVACVFVGVLFTVYYSTAELKKLSSQVQNTLLVSQRSAQAARRLSADIMPLATLLNQLDNLAHRFVHEFEMLALDPAWSKEGLLSASARMEALARTLFTARHAALPPAVVQQLEELVGLAVDIAATAEEETRPALFAQLARDSRGVLRDLQATLARHPGERQHGREQRHCGDRRDDAPGTG